MPAYTKSDQLGKIVNPKKVKRDGTKLSRQDDWNRARPKLNKEYEEKGISGCEYQSKQGADCGTHMFLGFAHDDNRNNLEPGELESFDHTLKICTPHHMLIENDKEETERLFKLRRPNRPHNDI